MAWQAVAEAVAPELAVPAFAAYEAYEHGRDLYSGGRKILGTIFPRANPPGRRSKKRAKFQRAPYGTTKRRKVNRKLSYGRKFPTMIPKYGNTYFQRRKPTNAQIRSSFPVRRIQPTPMFQQRRYGGRRWVPAARALRRRRAGIAARRSLGQAYRRARRGRSRYTRPAYGRRGNRRRLPLRTRRGPLRGRGYKGIRSYITGLPLSQTIWLNLEIQAQIKTTQGEWALVPFEMNSLLKPFRYAKITSLATDATVGEVIGLQAAGLHANHRFAFFAGKGGTIAEIDKRQPNGFDQLWARYNKSDTLESHITISHMPTDPQGSDRCVAGFMKGHYLLPARTADPDTITQPDQFDAPSFEEKYANTARGEVINLSSLRMLDNPTILSTGSASDVTHTPTTVFKKSWYKGQSLRKIKYNGSLHSNPSINKWYGDQTTDPSYRPVTYFCVADLGEDSNATLHVVIKFRHKVRLFVDNSIIPDESDWTAPV